MNKTNTNYINFSKNKLDELLHLAVAGNNNAFTELSSYVRHISYTYFKSKHRLGKIINEEDVEDLANNVYLSFAEQYNKVQNIEFWLRRVLFLSFVTWYKNEKKRRTFELDENYYIAENKNNPEDIVDTEKIVKLLNNFSEDKQQIVKLRFWGGLKFSEIAEQMDKSEVAVKKMFYRTIEKLKNNFK